MSFQDKVTENKKVARKCMEIKAYNAGVSRAYYSAFLHIKAYLKSKGFDYKSFIQNKPKEREYSHGSIRSAIVTCLMANGKSPADAYKMRVLDSMYDKRRRADYNPDNIIEGELKTSLDDLEIVLSTVT